MACTVTLSLFLTPSKWGVQRWPVMTGHIFPTSNRLIFLHDWIHNHLLIHFPTLSPLLLSLSIILSSVLLLGHSHLLWIVIWYSFPLQKWTAWCYIDQVGWDCVFFPLSLQWLKKVSFLQEKSFPSSGKHYPMWHHFVKLLFLLI